MQTNITRILLCLMLLMGIGTATAFADNLYVITDGNGNYLANKSGTLANADTFDPKTCVWTYSSDDKMANQEKYLSRSSSDKTILSVESSSSTEWTITDYKVSNKGQRNSYYIYYNNGTWSATTTQASGSNCYAVTKVETDAVESLTLDYTDDIEHIFERVDDHRDYTANLSYTPAYNTYTWTTDDASVITYYTSTDNSYVSSSKPEAITTASSYKWEESCSENNVTLEVDDEDPSLATASYDSRFDEDTNVTFTVTASIAKDSKFITSDVTLTATDVVTLKSRYITNLQLSVDKTTLYVGNTATTTYNGWWDEDNAKVTFSSSNADIAEVSGAGVITAKSTGGADATSVTITVNTSQTDDYEAGSASISITIKKYPTSLHLQYDKSTLTYGEDAPALTNATITNTVNDTAVTGTVYYSSSDRSVDVNSTTGALTINHAGTATITATYYGDDTHIKSSDTFTITVSKATSKVSFEHDSYIAQLTHDFESPVATLSPEGIGDVTYSYTSDTNDLISINATTGEVTLGTATGTATVTATFAGNDCYEASSASYVLTVTSKEIPQMTFDISKMKLYVDEMVTVTATTNSTNGITFSTTDESIFTVSDKGLITAKVEGVASLRITSLEDDTYLEVNADLPIMVKRYPTKVEGIYAQQTYYTDHVGNIIPELTLHETVNNNVVRMSKDELSFSVADNGVLTVDESTGQVTLLGDGGTVAITVAYAGNYKYEPSESSIIITVKKVTSPGTFVRLKNTTGSYLSSDGTTVTSSTTSDESSIIWYGTDRSLLFYQCGLYLKDATPSLSAVMDNGVSGTNFTLTHNGDLYNISDGTNTLTLGDSQDWSIEEVEYLPVTFNSVGKGFSTFYCPTDVTCPAGVLAYYPTARIADTSDEADYVITLQNINGGYIPHGTPVVLQTNYISTYKFYIVDEANHNITDAWDGLVGTVPAITTSSVYADTQCPYTLQPQKAGSSVGFYPWESAKHNAISAFRCYIPGASASNAKAFRFIFADDTTDGITDIDLQPSDTTYYYNLQGIPMGTDYNALPAGIYLHAGKKVVKRP